MKGSYVLLIELDAEERIRIGSLGEVFFVRGSYAYVGSAMNGLEQRVARHLRREKKAHWHIDYLLQRARIVDSLTFESDKKLECRLAAMLADISQPIARFGSSDCQCQSHLFYLGENGAEKAKRVVTATMSPPPTGTSSSPGPSPSG